MDAIVATVSDNYYRKLSTRNTLDLWSIVDELSANDSNECRIASQTETEFRYVLCETMQRVMACTVQHSNRIIDSAIQNRLIVAKCDTNGFRFVANRDTTAFHNLTHDWYCFECHSNNKKLITFELIQCITCWRAFHKRCIELKLNSDKLLFRCFYCVKREHQTSADLTIGVKRLNALLRRAFINCDYFLNEQMCDMLSFDSVSKLFVFKKFDLTDIKAKIETNQYKCLTDFETDVKQFEHNFHVSPKFAEKSIVGQFRKFSKLITKEIDDLKICVDCYQFSNEANYDEKSGSFAESEWFCAVCAKPHELVYAQIKGYSYWPSKVLRMTAHNQYDVRFFDPPNFTRGSVAKDRIKPITYQFSAEYIEKWKLEQPIRLMMAYMKKLDEKGLVIEQTITNGVTIKYKQFVQLIAPKLNFLKRKRDSYNNNNNNNNNNDQKRVKKMSKK